MKILILSPFIDAQHNISMRLRASGAALLFPSDIDEAWKMIELHGMSLDLAIINREGSADSAEQENNENGFDLLGRIKGAPAHADLPIIISSFIWGDFDFVQHQQGPLGANAYLRWPFTDIQLIQTIEAMFGNSIRFASATETQSEIVETPPRDGASRRSSDTTTASISTSALTAGGGTEPGTIPLSIDGRPIEQLLQDQGPAQESQRTGSTIALQASESPMTGTIDLEPPPLPPLLEPPPLTPEAPKSTTGIPLAPPDAGESAIVTGTMPPTPPPDPGSSHSKMLDLGEIPKELEPHERLALANPQVKPEDTQPTQPTQPTEALEPEIRLEGLGGDPGDTSGIHISFEPSNSDESSGIDIGQNEPPPSPPPLPDEVSPPVTSEKEEQEPAVSSQKRDRGQTDAELGQELPYLFSGRHGVMSGRSPDAGENEQASASRSAAFFTEPVGDAVVPGGAAQSPDAETLKKYLILREQDVAVLSNQLRLAREQSARLQKQLKEERDKNLDLAHALGEHQRKLEEFGKEKTAELGALRGELEEVRFQNRAKGDKARALETQVKKAAEEIERLKERVRSDIRKIRVREKELENRLEIMKKDSEALIAARETKIIELKRKVDLLEFNMDLLQDQYTKEKESSAALRERLSKAVQVVRVAEGLLEPAEKPAERSGDKAGEGARAKEAS